MAGASGPGLGALGALDPWVVGAGDAVAAGFRPQEKGLPAAWRRPGAPGAGGGPEAAPRRGGGRGRPPAPLLRLVTGVGLAGVPGGQGRGGRRAVGQGRARGHGGRRGRWGAGGGDCGHSGRAGPDEPLQPAPPPILSPRAQNHPRLPDGGAPRSAKDAMVSRGFPENVRHKALRGVSRGSDGRFHVSIRINPQKQAYIGSSEDVCVAARMRDVAEVLLFGPAADTAFDVRGYDLEAVLRLEWLSIGDFSSREAGIRDIAQMADHQGELARAERRAAREQGPLLPGMAAGDAFSMRDYVRECSRDFTLETHPFFFMEGVARQPPKRGRRFSKTPWRRRRLPKPSRPPRRPMARPRRGRCGRRRRRRSQASPSTSQRGRGVRTTGGLWGSRWGCRRRRTLSEALSSRCRTPLPPSARPCGTTGRPRPAGRPGRKSIPPPPPRPPGSGERG